MEHLDTYRRMVRFRDVVVHLYFAVDNRRVFEVIKNNLSDFDAFIGEMRSYLDKIGKITNSTGVMYEYKGFDF
jgi:uncharacterized protein YutE (UPF0331/DUF86 family)